MIIAGIDPGSKGSICILTQDSQITFLDLPATPLDIYKLFQTHPIDKVYLEDVHSLFGMSAKSNFNFGRNLGMIETLVQLFHEPIRVQPKVWQRVVGVTSTGNEIKANVADLCKHRYPDACIHGKRGGLLDGRSDALMIAHYGFSQETQ